MAVVEAAEDLAATTRPRGRLAVPLACVLDEAANVCRLARAVGGVVTAVGAGVWA